MKGLKFNKGGEPPKKKATSYTAEQLAKALGYRPGSSDYKMILGDIKRNPQKYSEMVRERSSEFTETVLPEVEIKASPLRESTSYSDAARGYMRGKPAGQDQYTKQGGLQYVRGKRAATQFTNAAADFIPGAGDIKGIYEALKNKDTAGLALASLGIIPGGDAAKMFKPVLKEYSDIKSAIKDLIEQAEKAGIPVDKNSNYYKDIFSNVPQSHIERAAPLNLEKAKKDTPVFDPEIKEYKSNVEMFKDIIEQANAQNISLPSTMIPDEKEVVKKARSFYKIPSKEAKRKKIEQINSMLKQFEKPTTFNSPTEEVEYYNNLSTILDNVNVPDDIKSILASRVANYIDKGYNPKNLYLSNNPVEVLSDEDIKKGLALSQITKQKLQGNPTTYFKTNIQNTYPLRYKSKMVDEGEDYKTLPYNEKTYLRKHLGEWNWLDPDKTKAILAATAAGGVAASQVDKKEDKKEKKKFGGLLFKKGGSAPKYPGAGTKDDCYRKAVEIYGPKTSAYRSSYMSKCRKNKSK